MTMKKKLALTVALVTVTGLTANAVFSRRGAEAPEVMTGAVSRGPIVSRISASGTLEAVTTVQVGTQVSGSVEMLYADFNSIVKKGQVLARLDQSLFQAAIDQARANLIRAEADRERLEVTLADARLKLERARELAGRRLIPQVELEAADVAVKSAGAQLRASDAQVTQARANLSQAEVNLQKTVITSPIDGIVIARNVDVGQTVAASLQAPTLFLIAADLREMKVNASIDEADLGQVREGQTVTFTVDAYPGETFEGKLAQVRLSPVVTQNVVTYAAIIAASNPDLRLKPGMTANVTVEVARRDHVLRVPAAALRFRPSDEVLAALGQAENLADASARPVGTSSRSGGAAVWVYDGGLHRVPVQTGLSDGSFTEIVEGGLEEGSQVATSVAAATGSQAATGSGNPLMPTGPPRRF
jgi:HlyD family secretion protein